MFSINAEYLRCKEEEKLLTRKLRTATKHTSWTKKIHSTSFTTNRHLNL